MDPKREKQKSCYEARISLDFLPSDSSFVYRSSNNMAALDPCPPALPVSSWHAEVHSQDVIVAGNDRTNEYVLVGAITAYRSLSYFYLHKDVRFAEIIVRQPYIKPNEEPEKILVLKGNDWRKLLQEYATAAAKEMGVAPNRQEKNLTGYCTWYYYYTGVSEAHFLENVEILKTKVGSGYSPAVIQIDDGYQTFQGDWLDQKATWPTPLAKIVKKITSANIKAGIWLMPFVASTASRTFREHPEWFVKSLSGEPLVFSGWSPPPDNLWACLDATNPAVQEHIQHFMTSFHKMGFRYFKMDGLAFGLPDGVYSDPDATPVSAFRLAMKIIRESVPDSMILGCCPPFMACLGFTDICRVSCDTAPRWVGEDPVYPANSAEFANGIKCAIQGTISNWWKNDVWFKCDPDVIVVREDNAEHTLGEARLSAAMGILTGIALTSDHLGKLSPERWKLLERAARYRLKNAYPADEAVNRWPYTFTGTVDGIPAALLLNLGNKKKTWIFADYNLPEICTENMIGLEQVRESLTLPPHDAALIIAEHSGNMP